MLDITGLKEGKEFFANEGKKGILKAYEAAVKMVSEDLRSQDLPQELKDYSEQLSGSMGTQIAIYRNIIDENSLKIFQELEEKSKK